MQTIINFKRLFKQKSSTNPNAESSKPSTVQWKSPPASPGAPEIQRPLTVKTRGRVNLRPLLHVRESQMNLARENWAPGKADEHLRATIHEAGKANKTFEIITGYRGRREGEGWGERQATINCLGKSIKTENVVSSLLWQGVYTWRIMD